MTICHRRDPGEQPVIAGVFLNRLRRGMPLQADPTVIFAIGDFSKQRVYEKDLDYDSPYNTYRNKGLPPGPICLPYTQAIDAVLRGELYPVRVTRRVADIVTYQHPVWKVDVSPEVAGEVGGRL